MLVDCGYGSVTSDAAAAMAAAVAAQATANGALQRSGGNLTGNVTANPGVNIDGYDLGVTLAAAEADIDAILLKTDHLAIVAGDLVVDVDLVPNGNETLTLGKAGANFLRTYTVDTANV